MMIARFGMAACVATAVASVSPAAAQDGAASPQSQYQQYQSQQYQQQPNQAPANGPVAPQYAGQQLGPTQQPPVPPPPFVLTPQQQADLDKVLDDWEQHSSKVTTFKCNFKHWKYDPTFLPPTLNDKGEIVEQPIKYSTGEIKYSAPDKGLIEEEDVWEMTNPGTPAQKSVERKYGEHWACDGKVLYAVDHEKREVHRTQLPPEMQGKFISEGPLPFAFGTKAAPLKARYYLQVSTPKEKTDEIWLDIRPRFQKDLTNFIEVDVILRAKDMLPTAIQITHAEVKVPIQTAQGQKIVGGRQREVYQFDEKWFTLPNIFADDFAPHPLGYKMINEQVPVAPPAPPANNPQARRQWPAAAPSMTR